MFKVLIVEDERRTARSIAQLVNEHPDFHVEGLAGNGAEALVLLGNHEIDLVLTDIRMPGIDGIQLLEILHKQFPDCLSVILSGYSEFEYARSAIQYGAFNYLLKPVDQDELTKVLQEAARRLSAQKQQHLHQQLQAALEGRPVPEDFPVQLVLLQGEPVAFWTQPEQLPGLQRYFGRSCLSFSRASSTDLLLVIASGAEISAPVRDFFPALQRSARTPVQLIYTEHAVQTSALSSAVGHLRQALNQQVRLFRSGCFSADLHAAVPSDASTQLQQLHPDRAVEAVCAQNREDLHRCLEQTLRTCTRRADLQNYLFAVIRDPRLAYQLPPGKLELLKSQLTQAISLATDPNSCLDQLVPQLLRLQHVSEHSRNLNNLAETLVQYLDLNYHQQISFDALAKQYGVSTRHLNKIFKDYQGVRPSEYLLDLRMERAKRMLTAKPDAMIKDVANCVGYTDPLYFSKVFQKATGHWPTEYQQLSQK